jgi:hypothetical protein
LLFNTRKLFNYYKTAKLNGVREKMFVYEEKSLAGFTPDEHYNQTVLVAPM